MSPSCRLRRRSGFTLVEILITIVIVTVGLFGVLALLTSALKVSGDVVENSFATTLARSVYESIREGSRNRTFIVKDPTGFEAASKDAQGFVRGFLFVHDGVKSPSGVGAPPAPPIPSTHASITPPVLPNTWDGADALAAAENLAASDFAVFLPPGPPVGASGTPKERYFVYPRPGPANGPPLTIANVANVTVDDNKKGNDNSYDPPVAGHGGAVNFVIRRVYRLNETGPGPVGTVGGGGGTYPRPDGADQYGFALVVSRAPAPPLVDPASAAPLDWSTRFPPRPEAGVSNFRDGLYRVEVLVFRNFDPDVRARRHTPVVGGTFVGLVSVGP